MFKLILKLQDAVVEEYTFDKTPITIGRREDNDVVIDNPAVSGHHAKIEAEPPNFFVLLDLDSLNGTYLGEKKIEREKLYDGDIMLVGKHSLVFEDQRPPAERPEKPEREEEEIAASEEEEPGYAGDPDAAKLNAEQQDESPEKKDAEEDSADDEQPVMQKPRRVDLYASITIMSGGIPQIIELAKRLTTLGKAEDSDIKCSGFWVGQTAAIISKRPNGFFFAYSEGKKPKVNGQEVATQVQLQDGDDISIGSTHMTFSLREEIQ